MFLGSKKAIDRYLVFNAQSTAKVISESWCCWGGRLLGIILSILTRRKADGGIGEGGVGG